MTRKNRVVFRMEGPEQNDQHLELSVFVEKTRQFLAFLKSCTREESSEDSAVFHVVSLSHSSPVVVECEPGGPTPLATTAVFNSVRKCLDLVENGQTHRLHHHTLSSMEKIAKLAPTKVARAEIQTISDDAEGERVYRLDDGFREKLSEARNAEEKVVSTIDGKLEQINIHDNANTFKIYTFNSSLACKFPDELLGNVKGALGAFVSVRGKCFYRPDAAFPYKIDVREMTILPPSEELPSLEDLFGIAPDATGDKTSEQFVRELRDQWSTRKRNEK